MRFTCLVLLSSCIFVSSAYPLIHPNNVGETAHASHVTNLERRTFRQCFTRLSKVYADHRGVINTVGTVTAAVGRDYAVSYKANFDAGIAMNKKLTESLNESNDGNNGDMSARLEACERKLKEVTEELEKEKKSKAQLPRAKSPQRKGHGLFSNLLGHHNTVPANPEFKNGAPKSILPNNLPHGSQNMAANKGLGPHI